MLTVEGWRWAILRRCLGARAMRQRVYVLGHAHLCTSVRKDMLVQRRARGCDGGAGSCVCACSVDYVWLWWLRRGCQQVGGRV